MDYATAYARLEKALTAVETFYGKTVLSGTECDKLIDAILKEMSAITIKKLAASNQQYVALASPFKAQKAKLERVVQRAGELQSALVRADELISIFRSLALGI